MALFSQYVGQALVNRLQVDALYTDFSKAFDRVDHNIFLKKIDAMGFNHNLTLFFDSYLRDRVQYVEVRGHQSYKFHATSGAPQGSNLAPLIFSIFINDICKNISSNVLLFADDLKIFKIVRCMDDCLALQEDLTLVERWCVVNNLPLNIGKCFSAKFSNRLTIIDYDYVLGNSAISKCETFKDLGVMYDTKLSFAAHIDMACDRAIKMLGFIIRNAKEFSSIQALKALYISYVRSRLEYGAVIFNPVYGRYTDQLENVQRKFLKFLCFKTDGRYPERGTEQNLLLQRFQLPALINRRNFLALQFLCKICTSFIDCPDLLMQVQFHVPLRATRSPPTFYLVTSNTNFLHKTPIYRAMNLFNESCGDIDIYGLSPAQLSRRLRTKSLTLTYT